ncbi:density-regulated protein isoform X1 [Hydra vulgaris]|nr:density-regulated protein [Hydra vulgaris]
MEDYPLEVEYCGICGLPPEYCEFGSEAEKCKDWLKENIPDLFDDLKARMEGLTTGDSEDKKKRQTRGGKANKLVKKKTCEKKVILKRETRSKKKCVTIISGLATFSIDPKKAAKVFANKFSCGSSVTGEDEIVIQGDVADDLIDFLQEKWPEIEEDNIEDNT